MLQFVASMLPAQNHQHQGVSRFLIETAVVKEKHQLAFLMVAGVWDVEELIYSWQAISKAIWTKQLRIHPFHPLLQSENKNKSKTFKTATPITIFDNHFLVGKAFLRLEVIAHPDSEEATNVLLALSTK